MMGDQLRRFERGRTYQFAVAMGHEDGGRDTRDSFLATFTGLRAPPARLWVASVVSVLHGRSVRNRKMMRRPASTLGPEPSVGLPSLTEAGKRERRLARRPSA
jgi:hypothetical protein